jgi:L-alanine-DL-glutamate epimerase-like enolase superfamily enzyme
MVAAAPLALRVKIERWPIAGAFTISRGSKTEAAVVIAELDDGRAVGRGECVPYPRYGETVEGVADRVAEMRQQIADGLDRLALQQALPPGAARNALDCAFWDLEAKQTGRPVWELAGLKPPRALPSTLTLGADSAGNMAKAALAIDPEAPIKVKLTGDLGDDIARVVAIRTARPHAWIGVDANQGYDIRTLAELLPVLVQTRVAQLEQPLQRGREADLDGLKRPLPFVADESAVTLADTATLVGRFDVVNIKLDKCGGLTEGLAIARQARKLGLDVMVGNMMGTSLSMAPSFVLGQLCDIVDLDGPTFLARDRAPGVEYRGGMIHCPAEIWG